jgi:hypothetical protein
MVGFVIAAEEDLLLVREAEAGVERHLTGKHPESIAIDPADPARIYVGTHGTACGAVETQADRGNPPGAESRTEWSPPSPWSGALAAGWARCTPGRSRARSAVRTTAATRGCLCRG